MGGRDLILNSPSETPVICRIQAYKYPLTFKRIQPVNPFSSYNSIIYKINTQPRIIPNCL